MVGPEGLRRVLSAVAQQNLLAARVLWERETTSTEESASHLGTSESGEKNATHVVEERGHVVHAAIDDDPGRLLCREGWTNSQKKSSFDSEGIGARDYRSRGVNSTTPGLSTRTHRWSGRARLERDSPLVCFLTSSASNVLDILVVYNLW